MAKKQDTFPFYKDKKNEWRWNHQAGNNKIIGSSTDGYKNKTDCVSNAKRNGYNPNNDKTKFEE